MPNVSGSPQVTESIKLDGAVYASPIAVDGVIVVATENDSVYGFDARGQQLWRVSSEPVAGPGAAVRRHRPARHHRHPGLQRADRRRVPRRRTQREVGPRHVSRSTCTPGKVRWSKSVDLPGPTPGGMQQRGALAITGGRVWVPFGAQAGDCGELQGPCRRRPARRHRGPGLVLPATRRRAASGIRPARRWTPPDTSCRLRERPGFPGDAYDHTNSVLELSPSAAARLVRADRLGREQPGRRWPRLAGRGPGRHEMGGARRQIRAGVRAAARTPRRHRRPGLRDRTSACPSAARRSTATSSTSRARTASARSASTRPGRCTCSGTRPARSPARRSSAGAASGLSTHRRGPARARPGHRQDLGQVDVGQANRFATPAIYGNLVLVPTLTGVVFVRTS